MHQGLYKFHPGIVGAVVGLSTGLLYCSWWLAINPAEDGLTDSETAWLLVTTIAVIVCFPILMTYFSCYAYPGMQNDPSKSRSDTWKIIALIVFSLSFGYALSIVVVFADPESISSATMWSLILGYAAIVAAQLYLIFGVPWVKWGRDAKGERRAASSDVDRQMFGEKAEAVSGSVQRQVPPDGSENR